MALFEHETSPKRPSLRRIVLFLLLQPLAAYVFFWTGIFTLIGAVWNGEPTYIAIFLLLVGGFELLALRIIIRNDALMVIGMILLISGLWVNYQHGEKHARDLCGFINGASCREINNGYICSKMISDVEITRNVNRDDVETCTRRDEIPE